MGRRKDQEARRAELGEATRRAVLERGIDGLRLKDVADQAGVTSAAVLYYYDGVEELITLIYREAVDRFCRQREDAVKGAEVGLEALLACIRAGVAIGPEDEWVRLLVELIPRSLRDPEVAALDAELYDRQEAVYREVLSRGEAQGAFSLSDSPDSLAAVFVALEDGFQLEVLAGRKTADEVVDHIAKVAGVLTGARLVGPE